MHAQRRALQARGCQESFYLAIVPLSLREQPLRSTTRITLPHLFNDALGIAPSHSKTCARLARPLASVPLVVQW